MSKSILIDNKAFRFSTIQNKLAKKGFNVSQEHLLQMIDFIDVQYATYEMPYDIEEMLKAFMMEYEQLFEKCYLERIFFMIKKYIALGWDKNKK